MTKGSKVSFFNTPILHHSIAENFKNFWQPLNYHFIVYNSDLFYLLAAYSLLCMAPIATAVIRMKPEMRLCQ